MKVRDGDKLLIHQINLTEIEIMKNIGKVVCIHLKNSKTYAKQLVFWGEVSWGIKVKQFVPEQSFFIQLKEIKALFVVDEVLSSKYVEQNSIFT